MSTSPDTSPHSSIPPERAVGQSFACRRHRRRRGGLECAGCGPLECGCPVLWSWVHSAKTGHQYRSPTPFRVLQTVATYAELGAEVAVVAVETATREQAARWIGERTPLCGRCETYHFAADSCA